MQETLHIRATVQPGSRIEIVNGQLQEGEEVDVVVSPRLIGKAAVRRRRLERSSWPPGLQDRRGRGPHT